MKKYVTLFSDTAFCFYHIIMLGNSLSMCVSHSVRHDSVVSDSLRPYGFSSSHVWMWEFDLKEGWTLKNWCIWTVVLEKTLEIPLDWKEIQPVNPKGNQSWISLEGLMLKLKLQCFGYLSKSWLIRKDLDAGKDWRKEEKGTTEDEMIGWHHCVSGHEFEQVPGDDEGQKSLVAAVHGVTKSWTWLSNWTTTWTVAHQASLSMRFSKQEFWSGLPFPPPADLPNPGIDPMSLMSPAWVGEFFTTNTTWEAMSVYITYQIAFYKAIHRLWVRD